VLIDTHCHLYFDKFDADRPAVIERMAEANVSCAVVVGIDAETSRQARDLAREHPELHYAAGLHPTSDLPPDVLGGGSFDAAAYLDEFWKSDPYPVAIGECGVDLYWDTNPVGPQLEAFTAQLRLGRERDLPVIVHSRSADAETRQGLEAVPGARGILHCFNGSLELLKFADEAERRGDSWYVSFAGNLTYKKAVELHEAAPLVPLDRLLVETDAPFMAPQAWRGKRNEPAYVVETARYLANLRGISEPEMQQILTSNSKACLGLDR